jgi:hypothetical protein
MEEVQCINKKSKLQCAPSKNLNFQYPHFATAKEMHDYLQEVTQPVRDFAFRAVVSN